MQITVKINGMDDCLKNIQGAQTDTYSATVKGITRVAVLLRDTITQYSQSGHPDHPNIITGRLSNSIRYRVIEGAVTRGYVGSDATYAPFVEFGHMQTMAWGHPVKSPNPVPAYPFFRPAIVEVFDSGQAQRVFENTIKEEVLR